MPLLIPVKLSLIKYETKIILRQNKLCCADFISYLVASQEMLPQLGKWRNRVWVTVFKVIEINNSSMKNKTCLNKREGGKRWQTWAIHFASSQKWIDTSKRTQRNKCIYRLFRMKLIFSYYNLSDYLIFNFHVMYYIIV